MKKFDFDDGRYSMENAMSEKPLQLPQSGLVGELKILHERRALLDGEVETRVHQFRQDTREKLGVSALEEKLKTLAQKAGEETRELLTKFIKDCFNGLYGKGQLAICPQSERFEPATRLSRYILLPENENNARKMKSRRREIIHNRNLLTEKSIKNMPLINDGRPEIFAEVSLEGTGAEEYQELFQKLKQQFVLGELLKVFPTDFKPVLNEGEILPYGSCDHHSGNIKGKIIVLPSGRLAVVADYYNSDQQTSKKEFLGVLKTPLILPEWDARNGVWAGEDGAFLQPTKEEMAFLTGKEIEINKGDIKLLEK